MRPVKIISINIEEEMKLNRIIDDLEAKFNQISLPEDSREISSQNLLKGILKKPHDNYEVEEIIKLKIFKMYTVVLIFILLVPLSFTDLYFVFTDNNCINDNINNLALSIKIYLFVSGFLGFSIMISLIVNICLLSSSNNRSIINIYPFNIVRIIIGLFNIVWNIIGTIIFCQSVYKKESCDKNISTYIFVSLIIKFIGNILAIIKYLYKK